MNILVVGDVHGCYHTLKALVEEHWRPEKEVLVQVGDLISKGPHSARCVKYMRKLQKKHPEKVFVLKGNHEFHYLKMRKRTRSSPLAQSVLLNFEQQNLNLKKVHNWLKELPLKWENENVLITHAGISKFALNPFSEKNPRGVLHNRRQIKNIGKLQVFGHKMQSNGAVKFKLKSNSYCIDTGAWLGKNLSALKIKSSGKVKRIIQLKTLESDLTRIMQ